MQLYAGDADGFLRDNAGAGLAEKIRATFYGYYGYQPPYSEIQSWQNSLSAMALQIAAARLFDTGIIVEMELPLSSSRLDVLIFGENNHRRPSGVIVELKQWSQVAQTDIDESVVTYLGGKLKAVAHPSRQALNYARYLADAHTSYHGPDAINLQSCAFLHNMTRANSTALREPKFAGLLDESPLFITDEFNEFSTLLRRKIGNGNGVAVLEKALSGTAKPARKLLQQTAAMIAGEERYTLLDDQIVAFERVLGEVRRANRHVEHSVIVVRGGPGTGKSVIALNLLGRLSKLGFHAIHATGSKSFTETLWKVVGNQSKPQFRYFNNFRAAGEGQLDVLICDEAHRVRKTSNNRYTKAELRTDVPQVVELIRAARVSVFFIDDFQSVRPDEIGSAHLIRESAVELQCRYHEIDLAAQFRCAGSDVYLTWVDQLLEIKKTGTISFPANDRFELTLVESAEALDAYVRTKLAMGSNARIVAGFCWKWSEPDEGGRLPDDVVIGSFKRPWNAKPAATKFAKGIPTASLWAWEPGGVDQVGCVYTAQGFEFDFVGVIIGGDLVIRNGTWVGVKTASRDPAFRGAKPEAVLLTRGLRGAAVLILDDETREFVRARIQIAPVS